MSDRITEKKLARMVQTEEEDAEEGVPYRPVAFLVAEVRRLRSLVRKLYPLGHHYNPGQNATCIQEIQLSGGGTRTCGWLREQHVGPPDLEREVEAQREDEKA